MEERAPVAPGSAATKVAVDKTPILERLTAVTGQAVSLELGATKILLKITGGDQPLGDTVDRSDGVDGLVDDISMKLNKVADTLERIDQAL